MGQEQSTETETREVTPEQFGNELALRFAEKCYSQLELYCFKQVFRNLADRESDIRFWSESSLCRFLELPDVLSVGPIVYQMVTFLGAFPFPSQAPCIVTKEALIKVVTLMTERHQRVLKRGSRDRLKLFYGSLAVFDRRASEKLETRPEPSDLKDDSEGRTLDETAKAVSGFAIDEPSNDDDDEIQNDDDELALAALDALDDVEAISLSEKPNLQHSIIPADNLLKLIELLLLIAPLLREDSLSTYTSSLTDTDWNQIRNTAAAVMSLFGTEDSPGVTFRNFRSIVPNAMPYMFDGLSPMFERFLFQKDFDLSKRKTSAQSPQSPLRSPSYNGVSSPSPAASIGHSRTRNATVSHAYSPISPTSPAQSRHSRSASYSSVTQPPNPPRRSMSLHSSTGTEVFPEPIAEEPQPYLYQDVLPHFEGDNAGTILTPPLLSQLSFFLSPKSLFNRLNPLYSGTTHGFSLNSFEKQVFSWHGASLLLVRGTVMDRYSQIPTSNPAEGTTAPLSPTTPASGTTNPSERHFHNTLPPQRHSPSVSPGQPVIYGAYLPQQLRTTHKAPISNTATLLFQLSPTHDTFRASDISTNHTTFTTTPTSTLPGLSCGCPLPTPNAGAPVLPLGAVSLFLDGALEYGVFSHSAAGGGSFYPSTAPIRGRY
ncbi:MAG: hypothetical protein Q9162_001199, partial [Coniocarpon cinnabarinum]